MRLNIIFTSLLLTLFFTPFLTNAQSISGSVRDANTNETLIGASVVIKGTTIGSTVDVDGNFEIKTSNPLPLTLVISFIGYVNQEVVVKSFTEKIKIKLKTDEVILDAVEITDTRISEKQQQAALTVEAMDIIAIKEAPSGNFYEGLANLKGVDLTSASLGFKVINTRGFNSTSPVRSLQLIDGVDNQSPGLNFSLGNFLGSSDLDVMKVDIIAGASSAFFGPNAFNGVINMTTKSPFLFPGLSASVKVGERNLTEYAARWAQVFKNKDGKDRFAYKLNIFYFKANDWEATNYDPVYESKVGKDNPGGFDAVNIYGDEALNGGNDYSKATSYKRYAGLGEFYRTGYKETDLVDYNTNNLKTQASLHYKITDKIEAIMAANYSTGSTIYQGDNRYALKNIQFYQGRFEIKQDDKFFIRFYATGENAGNSYDAVLTGFLMSTASKPDRNWFRRYADYWDLYVRDSVSIRTGIPGRNDLGFWTDADKAAADAVLSNYQELLTRWHNDAKKYAYMPTSDFPNQEYLPGTSRFDSLKNDITSRRFTENGSKFYDKSRLYHGVGEYKFQPNFAEIIVGGNFRLYTPDSKGTIFSDTLVNRADTTSEGYDNINGEYVKIKNIEFGFYAGIERKILEDKLKLTLAARIDKNQNFNYVFSPAVSAVYSPKLEHTFRVSFSSALRNPTLADQYLSYNVGRAVLLGNLNGFEKLATVESTRKFIDMPFPNPDSVSYFSVNPIQPEQVRTVELGYRGTLWNKVYVDFGYYYSFYTNFIGYKIGVDLKLNPNVSGPATGTQVYRIAANADGLITTQGLSMGANYFFAKRASLNVNYSYNVLNNQGDDEQIIPAFNTPKNKFNIGFTARELNSKIDLSKIWNKLPLVNLRNWGYNVNYKYVEGFLFEGSPQFTGVVPTYDMVDAQISYKIPKWYTTFRFGASNLFGISPFFKSESQKFGDKLKESFNNSPIQVFGGPYVGRLAYFSILFEFDMKK